MNARVEKDMLLKIVEVIGPAIDRELKIAAVVLPGHSVGMLHLKLSAAIATQAIANTCANLDEAADLSSSWDMMSDVIASVVAGAKADSISVIPKARQAARAAGRRR